MHDFCRPIALHIFNYSPPSTKLALPSPLPRSGLILLHPLDPGRTEDARADRLISLDQLQLHRGGSRDASDDVDGFCVLQSQQRRVVDLHQNVPSLYADIYRSE